MPEPDYCKPGKPATDKIETFIAVSLLLTP